MSPLPHATGGGGDQQARHYTVINRARPNPHPQGGPRVRKGGIHCKKRQPLRTWHLYKEPGTIRPRHRLHPPPCPPRLQIPGRSVHKVDALQCVSTLCCPRAAHEPPPFTPPLRQPLWGAGALPNGVAPRNMSLSRRRVLQGHASAHAAHRRSGRGAHLCGSVGGGGALGAEKELATGGERVGRRRAAWVGRRGAAARPQAARAAAAGSGRR